MEQNNLFIEMVLKAWYTQVANTDKLLDSLSDEDLMKEVSPGKNRVIYLLGHSVAVHDDMIRLLELGERQYANLDEAFINNPDRAVSELPPASELRDKWKKQNELLAGYFNKITPGEWFTKHTAVSAEDFAKEPFRNKLNIIINRTGHLAYHLGQMRLVK